jgi:hypothetical protein
MKMSLAMQMVDISDLCRKVEMEMIAGGKFAENGKLVDQPDIYQHYREACIHMAFLAWQNLKVELELADC